MVSLNVDVQKLAELLADEVAKQVTQQVMESLKPQLEQLTIARPTDNNSEVYLNRQMLAERLGISVSTVDRYTADECIPVIRIGKRVIYSESEVRAALDRMNL